MSSNYRSVIPETPSTSTYSSANDNHKRRTVILVLGMHRSGTSALTRTIGLLGAALPSDLMPPKEGNNEAGFWESNAVYRLNDRVLRSLDSSWDDWTPLPDSWADRQSLAGMYNDAIAILEQEFGQASLFVLKDPRICRLLPFWLRVFARMEIHTLCVIPLRSPAEVAASLAKRDQFGHGKSYALWLHHFLEAEHSSRDTLRAFVRYDHLLADWRSAAATLARDLEFTWPHPVEDVAKEIDHFLNPSQRHHNLPLETLAEAPAVSAWILEAVNTFDALCKSAYDLDALSKLNNLRERFRDAAGTLGTARNTELAQLRTRLSISESSEQSLNRQVSALERTIAELHSKAQHAERSAQQQQQQLSDAIYSLENTVATQVVYLNQARDTISEQTTLAKTLDAALRDKSSTVEQLGQALTRKSSALAQQQKVNSASKAEMAFMSRTLEILEDHLLRAMESRASDALRTNHQRPNPLSVRLDRRRRTHNAKLRGIAHNKLVLPPVRFCGITPSLREYVRLYRQAHALMKTELFDPNWYLAKYPDVADARLSPLWHWMYIGWREGRRPNALFDTPWYLERNPDVSAAGINPAYHYLKHGADEGRDPSPLFSNAWYLQRYADVTKAGLNPLSHYLKHGAQERRSPNAYFDPKWYVQQHPALESSPVDPLEHYLMIGGLLGYDPSPRFSSRWYLGQYKDVAQSGLNPLAHYLHHGANEGRHPLPPDTKTRVDVAPHPAADGLAALQPLEPVRFTGNRPRRDGAKNVLLCAHAANGELFGGERSFLDLAELLAGLDCNTFVCLPKATPSYIDLLLPLSVEVICLPYAFWSASTPPAPDVIAAFQAYMLEQKIDLAHVNTIMIREPLVAARRLGIPAITHVRESAHNDRWITSRIGLSADAVVHSTLDGCDLVIANSQQAAEEFDKTGRTCIVPNTFDLDALDIRNKVKASEICVGLLSSNLPKKGIEDFALLAAACAPRIPNLKFCLIGPDNEHTALLRKRQKAGEFTKNLTFIGYQEHPVEALAKINIIVSLSHFAESFGRTIAEGLAARRPAIVYDHGAVAKLVTHGVDGALIPRGDWHAAIPILEQWCSNPEGIAVMGEAGRQKVSALYGRDAGRRALKTAYEEALKGRPEISDRPALARANYCRTQTRDELKIAYFCWHFPVPSETFVLNELRLLVEWGYDVRVFCRQSPYPDFTPDFDIQWERVTDDQALAEALVRTGRNYVHGHFVYPTVTDMVWPACERAGIPFSFIAHAQDIFKYDNDKRNRIDEIAASPLCRAIFTLGTFHRDYLIERNVPASKLIINPNSIDPSLFPFRPHAFSETPPLRRICAIHRLTEKKGLSFLIEAAAQLPADQYEFNIYGYGDEEAKLNELIRTREIRNVHILGPLRTRDEILEVLQQHDLFACPSVRTVTGDMDGIPTVLLESMAAGTPVITTDVASIPDLVQDGLNGIVVPPKDASSLASGIERFYALGEASRHSMTAQARKTVEQHHDARTLTRRLARVWTEATIDIVIVSWNNLAELKEVVSRIFRFTKSSFHLIICDNASGAETVGYLCLLQASRDNVTVIFRAENSYVGPGTNVALDHGTSAYGVYLCGKEGFALAEGWETPFVEYMDANPEVGLAGTPCYSPTYMTGRDYPSIPLFGQFRNPGFAADHPEREFAHVQGGLFVIRRKMYDEIGGFSEAVPHAYTDVEYSYYAESCGWKLGTLEGMIALYNKTRPDIWARVDESVRILHPPRLQDLPKLDRIANRKTHFCNVCGWDGAEFESVDSDLQCPQCGSRSAHRSLYRHLAESSLTYRGLTALWLEPHPCLSGFWQRAFRGLVTTLDAWNAGSAPPECALIVATITKSSTLPELREMLRQCAEVLSEDGQIVLALSPAVELSALEQAQLSDDVRHLKMTLEQAPYASATVGYTTQPLLLIRRDRSENPVEQRGAG